MNKLLVISLLTFSNSIFSMDDFDFILMSKKCEMLISFNKFDEDSLQKHPADLSLLHCIRNNKEVECDISHPETEDKITRSKYTIHLDSPPTMMFSTDNGSEMILINTSELSASYTSRRLDLTHLGSKVCSMMFLTKDQYDSLGKDSQ